MIDFHTHLFPPEFARDRIPLFEGEDGFRILYESPKARLVGAEEIIQAMDEGGIRKSVIFGFPWERETLYKTHNDYIVDAVRRYPDRLIGFACFSPTAPGAAREAERCLAAGLRGIGELAVYGGGLTGAVTRGLSEVMEICRAHDAPLLMHVNEPVGHSYPGKAPMTLAEVYTFVAAYPENRIVLAHWGGGIFFYALMKKEVRERLANVWFDTAASPYLYEPAIYRIAGEIIGYDRILLGSDYPLLKPSRYLTEMKAAGLSDEALQWVTGGNAADVLGSAV
ncbi:Amidohydrolase family protein [uncultured Desulfatiglans sp.]|uniref:Amidohydrolase family protein n=1 Tax=Uncultured Desulfatiglans sp. TaxID=1748965 RepID=A0A653AC21_UNCDX|nr:Amidohydrolase family protein [uncultured Desulfatiglans sp.]